MLYCLFCLYSYKMTDERRILCVNKSAELLDISNEKEISFNESVKLIDWCNFNREEIKLTVFGANLLKQVQLNEARKKNEIIEAKEIGKSDWAVYENAQFDLNKFIFRIKK